MDAFETVDTLDTDEYAVRAINAILSVAGAVLTSKTGCVNENHGSNSNGLGFGYPFGMSLIGTADPYSNPRACFSS